MGSRPPTVQVCGSDDRPVPETSFGNCQNNNRKVMTTNSKCVELAPPGPALSALHSVFQQSHEVDTTIIPVAQMRWLKHPVKSLTHCGSGNCLLARVRTNYVDNMESHGIAHHHSEQKKSREPRLSSLLSSLCFPTQKPLFAPTGTKDKMSVP